jgi:heterodisulfide reductase subunit A2
MPECPKTAVVLCTCSGIICGPIDWARVQEDLAAHPARPRFRIDELACGHENLEALAQWLREEGPSHVVVAACSPREHETTFRRLLESAGINPYLLQMVNVREHVAWVTPDPAEATPKATRLIQAALNRVRLHEPLQERQVPVRTDAVILGAGPAGMQAALTLARAGRRVTLVERESFLGGQPVRFEELFPNLECGPCLLEPLMGDILHGPEHELITLLTLAEVVEVRGSFGAWTLSIRQQPRYIDPDLCIGCMLCATACPERRPHAWNGAGEMPAVDVAFGGALPSLPHVDPASCLRLRGQDCDACIAECPVEGALDFSQTERLLTVEAGAILLATGATELRGLPVAFAGAENAVSAYDFERLLAMNGPTGGELLKADGSAPRSIAIVHCAGSLDAGEIPYCSGTCCRAALKYAHLAAARLAVPVSRLVREQVVPGVDAARQLAHDTSRVARYEGPGDLSLERDGGDRVIRVHSSGEAVPADLVVLCRPIVPGSGTRDAARLLELGSDGGGFLAPVHALSGSCATSLRGVYLAGSCRGPGDIREAFASGTAAAGLALSDLVEGRDLVLSPQVAVVDPEACSGCRTCLPLCPYKAISWQETERVSQVADLLCQGCGTCVAACPSGAIAGKGFTRAMLRAELEGILS